MEFKILGVHTEEVACKQRCFVSASTATNLHHHVLAVLWVLGQKHKFHLLFKGRDLWFKGIYLSPCHLFEFGVGLIEIELLGFVEVGEGFLVLACRRQDTLQVVVLAVETHIACLVGYHCGVCNQQAHLVELRL